MTPDPLAGHTRETSVGVFPTFPLTYGGGGERFAMRLANSLVDAGMRVTLFTDEDRRNSVGNWQRDQLVEPPKCELVRASYSEPCRAPIAKRAFYRLPSRSLLERSSVSILFLNRVPPVGYLRALSSSRSPIILALHGIALENHWGSPLSAAYQLYLRIAFRFSASWFRSAPLTLVAVNRTAAEKLTRLGISRSRVKCIPNTINPDAFHPVENRETFDLIFVGRLHDSQKGIRLLCHVLNEAHKLQLPNLRASVIGSGPSSSLLTRLRGRGTFVNTPGAVSEQEKIAILASGGAFLCTSIMDPGPVSVLEALASGLPVLSTPVTGVVEVLSEPVLGRVLLPTPSAFVSAIRSYYAQWKADPDAYFRERLERRRRSGRWFEFERMMEAYSSVVLSAAKVSTNDRSTRHVAT